MHVHLDRRACMRRPCKGTSVHDHPAGGCIVVLRACEGACACYLGACLLVDVRVDAHPCMRN